jgi:hypothetical protein
VADALVARLEKVFPGLKAGTIFRRVLGAVVAGRISGGKGRLVMTARAGSRRHLRHRDRLCGGCVPC